VFVSITGALFWMLAGIYLAAHKYHSYAAMAVAEEMPFGGIEMSSLLTGTVKTFMKTLARNTGRDGVRHAKQGLAARSTVERFGGLHAAGQPDRSVAAIRAAGPGKPRVLILPNVASGSWDRWSMHIMRRFQDEYEFWILTDNAPLRPTWSNADRELDFIFRLTDKSYKLLRAAAGTMKLPPSISGASCDHMEPIHAGGRPGADELLPARRNGIDKLRRSVGGDDYGGPHGVTQIFFTSTTQRFRFGMPQDAFVIGFIGTRPATTTRAARVWTRGSHGARSSKELPNLHVCFLGLGWDEEVRQFQQQGVSATTPELFPRAGCPHFIPASMFTW